MRDRHENSTEQRPTRRALLKTAGAVSTVALVGTATATNPPDSCRTPGQPAAEMLTTDDPSVCYRRVATQGGEGVITLELRAPGVRWDRPEATSVTVDVQINDRPAQQVVLYQGESTGEYQGFIGSLEAGVHTISITLRPDLTWPPTHRNPTVDVQSVALSTVPPDAPQYDAVRHAPVLYGRDDNTHSDVPLVGYTTSDDQTDGVRYEYTMIYSNEDGGSGIVPAYLMGKFGRLTDIETTVRLTVPDDGGPPRDVVYQGCGYPLPSDELTCSLHEDKPFTGEFFYGHPIIRVASDNNVHSDDGRTKLRFQPPFQGETPGAGEPRERAMDKQPLTYRIMDQEAKRENVTTTRSESFNYGDARQYVYVDLRGDVTNGSVAVDVRFTGDTQFYSTDYTATTTSRLTEAAGGPATPGGYPFYTGGAQRTVVKGPTDAHDRELAAVRFRLGHTEDPVELGGPWNPTEAQATITDVLHLFTLDDSYRAGDDRFELDTPVELDNDTRTVVRDT